MVERCRIGFRHPFNQPQPVLRLRRQLLRFEVVQVALSYREIGERSLNQGDLDPFWKHLQRPEEDGPVIDIDGVAKPVHPGEPFEDMESE